VRRGVSSSAFYLLPFALLLYRFLFFLTEAAKGLFNHSPKLESILYSASFFSRKGSPLATFQKWKKDGGQVAIERKVREG
jgi:hypothetical protein